VYMMGSLKLPATFLIFVSALALLTSLLGLSFPYSAANQCPKRVFFQVRIVTNVIYSIKHERHCFVSISKHREESCKYDGQWSIFDKIQGVWIANETVSLECSIYDLN